MHYDMEGVKITGGGKGREGVIDRGDQVNAGRGYLRCSIACERR